MSVDRPSAVPRSRPITADELAAEAGVSRAYLERLEATGVLRRGADGRFESADIARVAEVERLVAAGIGLEVIGQAIDQRSATLEYVGYYFPEPAPFSGLTYAEFRASLGPRGGLLGPIYAALGLGEPADDSRLRTDEEALIRDFVDVWSVAGDDRELFVRAARVAGESMQRIISVWGRLYGERIFDPINREGPTGPDQMLAAGMESTRLVALAAPFLTWLQRRHLEHIVTELNVEGFEAALAARGLPSPVRRSEPAIAFVDLSSYTRLTEEAGDERAADWATTLQELAADAARGHDGRVVKLLGDGVMLRFRDATRAVEGTLALMDRIDADPDLPAGHAGIESGAVIERDGDVYGRTVNLAARLAGVAAASEIVVGSGVVERAFDEPGAANGRLESLGMRELKGFAAPVAVWRVRRRP
jgi:adenylate cyclase